MENRRIKNVVNTEKSADAVNPSTLNDFKQENSIDQILKNLKLSKDSRNYTKINRSPNVVLPRVNDKGPLVKTTLKVTK